MTEQVIVDEGFLTFGHSPDPDDAFMFYGFHAGGVCVELEESSRVRRWQVRHELQDIQTLNERALRGELEITAISAHAYPHVADRYWVMRTGVSMGDGYGPIVVAREPLALSDLRGKRIGIPGKMTTAALVYQILAPEHEAVPVFFDQMQEAVRTGQVDAGVIIHEGQLTYQAEGLHAVADLGVLWKRETGLPLPLGLDVVRKDLGPEVASAATRALQASIRYARKHHRAAMDYALEYGRGLDDALGDRFVDMYVNDWTLDMGEAGQRALRLLLDRGAERGLVPKVGDLVFV
ncbi:MAG: ABC transporter substrate-binding protein [Candidatus Eisenbacteria bacterium]|uniref:1,4-dihydroxy-6-naphtoate synthase n=1 Tax=Eiseniibacteriota bacterium TaxID=2212470 RepID=A0A956LYW0_UNCEI|nr:ABC transporter substrate-binding protein [Candidatus Eisenbacteria bacterium]